VGHVEVMLSSRETDGGMEDDKKQALDRERERNEDCLKTK